MLNRSVIMGRICNELEMRTTGTGTEVLSFTIASERDYKNKNGEKETDFIDVVAYKNTAIFVNTYFGKGRMIVVEGKLQTQNWEDKNGNKRKSVEVIAENVYFADSKPNKTEEAVEFEEIPVNNDPLPF